MIFDLIIVVLLIQYLKKSPGPELTQAWKTRLHLILLFSVALLVFGSVTPNQIMFFQWTSHALVWGFVIFLYRKKEWKNIRPVLYPTLPLLILKTVADGCELIAPAFYRKWEQYFDLAILFGIVWVVALVIINRRQRKALDAERLKLEEKEREMRITEQVKATLEKQVQERTADLVKQKEELEEALDKLKATQAQLIHAEKMASLGELTAGIAHEIQNPLNFVNNFSEVSNELIAEMNQELEKGDLEEAKAIGRDIRQNLEKIHQHGKRADSIVKGMLQHSRSSAGQREPTDINALCDEFLRLSYHGLRAKDKSFNANFELKLDEGLEKISVSAQEIGRVLLNLINNAFYTVSDKKKTAGKEYQPTVTVATKKIGNKVGITVSDNGNGMPASVKEKIFQPFFTTKPSGQGTGLGLSLSYDIIKVHNGEIQVESREGEGTVFTILLPI